MDALNCNVKTRKRSKHFARFITNWLTVAVWFMVFNATFNNSSAILWRSVLLVEDTGVPTEVTDKLYNVVITCAQSHCLLLEQ